MRESCAVSCAEFTSALAFPPPSPPRYLNMCRNQIREFPVAVCGASDLKHLDVSYNMIASLPPEVSFFTALTTLDLRYNKLNTVPLEMAVLFAHPNEGKVAPVWDVCARPRTHFTTHTHTATHDDSWQSHETSRLCIWHVACWHLAC